MGAAPSSQSYLATYEMSSGDGFSGANISQPYDGLLYQGFNYGPFDEEAGQCAFVCASSFPVDIAFTASPGASANITSSYVGSNVTHFTPSDFFFGCNGYFSNLTEPTTGQALPNYEQPVNCSLKVVAYTSLNKPAVAKQTFQYHVTQSTILHNSETGAPYQGMSHYSFDSAFKTSGIRYLKFTASGPATGYAFGSTGEVEGPLGQSVPSVLLDNFNYTVYYT